MAKNNVLYNLMQHLTQNKDFLIVKTKPILFLIESIIEKKSLYTDALDRKDPVTINKKMLNKSKITKMLEVKYITPESKHTTFTQSGSRIQFI